MTEVRCLWEAAAILGEGPLWSPREAALYWVDIKAPALHRYRPSDGDKTSWKMPEPIGWVIVGGLLFGTLLTLFVVPATYTILSREKKTATE